MTKPILVFNSGRDSLKVALIDDGGSHRLDLGVAAIGAAARLLADGGERAVATPDAATAAHCLIDELAARGVGAGTLAAVGHRLTHGGAHYTGPTVLDAAVEAALESQQRLPDPGALATVRVARTRLTGIAQVAVFDTAFHATLPRRAREYALPADLSARLGLRRVGFHGISHEFVAAAAAAWLRSPLGRLRIVSCHLGANASVTAVEYGRSVETSTGFSPLEGLVGATRAGDLDPGIVLELHRTGMSVAALERLLTEESGLMGMTGSPDMRVVEERAAQGDDACRLALLVYAHRIRKYIGAYAAVMGGVDAILFTGGVGEHSALIRHRIAQRLDFLGAELDEDRNRDAGVGAWRRVAAISVERARCALLVVATDEAAAIAAATHSLLAGTGESAPTRTLPIAVSARHVHLSAASVAALYGAGHRLTPLKPISQPGQFAANEAVTLVGPRGRIEHVRVVGPAREHDQVEIARSDEYLLGIDAPVRESGDLDNTPGIRVEGPAGAVTLRQGVICALRHIHMAPAEAVAFGVADGDRVVVRVTSQGRELTFGDVCVRVRSDYRLEMHVDTDEGNAAGLAATGSGVLVAVEASASLVRRR